MIDELFAITKTTIIEAEKKIIAANTIEIKRNAGPMLIIDMLLNIMLDDIINFGHIVEDVKELMEKVGAEKLDDELIALAVDYAQCKLTMTLYSISTLRTILSTLLKSENAVKLLEMLIGIPTYVLEKYAVTDENSLCSATSIHIAHILVQTMILRWGWE